MFLFLRRFLARLFDYGLFYFLTVFISLVLPLELEGQTLLLWALVTPLVWAPFEMMLLKGWHTTPGKKLFGLAFPPLGWKESFRHAFCLQRSRDLLVKPIGIKRYLIALILACTAGSALFLGDDIAKAAVNYEGQSTVSGWVQYVSDDGKFQVHFPKEPKQDSKTFEAPGGESLNLNEFKAHKKAEFSVSYLDFPKKWRLFSSTTLLKGAMKVIVEHMPGAKLLDHKIVKHKNYPAMDFRIQEGDKTIEGRLILVGGTLYKLWVVYFPDTPREQQHETFLGSFELNP